jgi:putative hydrolase of the HAD superfamily
MIKNYKHYSFDLWLTLIKSNPKFKKERALYFYKKYNTHKSSIEEVENIFRSVDLMCNAINEKTGRNVDSEEMYLMVIYQLNQSNEEFIHVDCNELYSEMDELFFKYSPTLYDQDVINTLVELKQNPLNSLNILSNTAFIKGATLRNLLNVLDISQYFDFQIYSDEVGVSKPNIEIFRILLDNVYKNNKNRDLTLNEIIHIGDNIVADIFGAKSIGIETFQVNSNTNKIIDILDLCKQVTH